MADSGSPKPYLNFTPEFALVAAYTVHDARDVEELQPKLFLQLAGFSLKQLRLVKVVWKLTAIRNTIDT